MDCPACGSEQPDSARFCIDCGAPLTHACPQCGATLPERAKFCAECGTPIAAAVGAGRPPPSPASYTPKHLAERILTTRRTAAGWPAESP